MDTNILIALIGGYLLGSVPFGLVITKLAGHGDIREIGSGNIGATNVLRTGRKDLALATLLLDAGKGAIAVLLAYNFLGSQTAAIAGMAAFIGHCFSVYLKFKGGKGVATFMGTLLAINFFTGLATIGVWLATAALFRISSLSALVASLSAPITSYLLLGDTTWTAISFMTLVIFIRHKDNIGRIAHGEESKIGQKD